MNKDVAYALNTESGFHGKIQGIFSHLGQSLALPVEVLAVEWLVVPKEEKTYISLKVTGG